MRAYPEDSEAAIFYAMGLTGTQAADDKSYAALLRASAILEPLFERMPDHPGLAQYIIHAFGVPPLASRALAAARKYGAIASDAPHALHMPSHTFTRLGLWTESIDANVASAASARRASHRATSCTRTTTWCTHTSSPVRTRRPQRPWRLPKRSPPGQRTQACSPPNPDPLESNP